MVTVRIPAPPAGLVSNLVGLAGLAAICVALAFLTDWRWGTMLAGVFGIGLAVLSGLDERRAEAHARKVVADIVPLKKSA